MRTIWKKVSRRTILIFCFFLPAQRKKSIERWWRGRDDFRRLQGSDWVLVSWGKSGRTWLRVMLSRAYQLKHGLAKRHLLGFDNLNRKNAAIPKIFFTHGNYLKDYTKNYDSKSDFYAQKVVLLVRDPRDVAVSQFFQWKYRTRPRKKMLNDYPAHGEEVSIFEFAMKPEVGVSKIIDFLNGWATEIDRLNNMLIIRYEDMRANPEKTLQDVLRFVGTPASSEHVREAVDFASYDNMKKLEEKKTFWLSGGRLKPRDHSNPNSYKVRRGKVGGYRDYFNDEEIAQLDELVSSRLSPLFRYTGTSEATPPDSAEDTHGENHAQPNVQERDFDTEQQTLAVDTSASELRHASANLKR